MYARCSAIEKLELWEDLEANSGMCNDPWIIEGYFNVIIEAYEKQGGLPVTLDEVFDFSQCVNVCNFTDLKYHGSDYTWWKERIEEECIFKRLDRVLVNEEFVNEFSSS